MALGDHLEELRRRLIYALIGLMLASAVTLAMGSHLVAFFRMPYVRAMEEVDQEPDLKVLGITDGLTTFLKMSLIAGVVIASPWIFYQFWKFISAGLYVKERRAALLAVPASAGLFIAGALFFMFVVAVPIITFLVRLNNWLDVETDLTFASHVGFMARMALIFGLAFQTPLVVLILGLVGVVTLGMLNHYRRHVVVALLVAAMLLTPPDPISQLCLAAPMWILYELGVLLVWVLVPKARARRN